MSLFFVLPPRPLLGEHFVAYLRGLFPGLDWDARARSELAEALAAARSGGGPEAIEKHRKRNKMPARERVEKLIDPKSFFLELSPLAAKVALDALQATERHIRDRLADPSLGIDEEADLVNDLGFVGAVQSDLQKSLGAASQPP